MIPNILITTFTGFLNNLINLMPTADVDTVAFLQNGVAGFNYYTSIMGMLFPINTFLQMLLMIITIELTMFGIATTFWIIRFVRTGWIR
jgi:hypothetical protein